MQKKRDVVPATEKSVGEKKSKVRVARDEK